MLALAMEQGVEGEPRTQWSGSVHRKKEERIMGTGNTDAE